MPKLQSEIAETFIERLKESPDVTPEMLDRLSELLTTKCEKLKADDLVKVFSSSAGANAK